MQKQIVSFICFLLASTWVYASERGPDSQESQLQDGGQGKGVKRKSGTGTGLKATVFTTPLPSAWPPVIPPAPAQPIPVFSAPAAPLKRVGVTSAFKTPAAPLSDLLKQMQKPALSQGVFSRASGTNENAVQGLNSGTPIVLGQLPSGAGAKTDAHNNIVFSNTLLGRPSLNTAKFHTPLNLSNPIVSGSQLSDESVLLLKGYQHLRALTTNPGLCDDYFELSEKFCTFVQKLGPNASDVLKQLEKDEVFTNAFDQRYQRIAAILEKLAEIASQKELGNVAARICMHRGESYNLENPPPPLKFTVEGVVSFYAGDSIFDITLLPGEPGSKGLRFLPPQITEFEKLERLSCSHNGLYSFGDLSKTAIKTLDLSDNKLGFNFDQLPKGLKALNLSQNPLMVFCPDLSAFKNLKVLALQNTGLSGEFDGLSLNHLEQLDVSRNNLTFLRVPNTLQVLLANANDLKDLPQGIGQCKQLSCLDLRYNKIGEVEAQMLPASLQQLLLGSGALKTFTNFNLGKFPNLRKIDLKGLVEVPLSILDPNVLEQRRQEMPDFELILGGSPEATYDLTQ